MKKVILTIALFCIFFACKREYDESKFGPEVIIVPMDFTVPGFSVSPSNTVSLATEDVYFNCAMAQRAEFKIIIKGILSGAEKTISGVGAYIDAGNGTWTGDSDNLNIFRMGEDCSVELSFHGATKKYYDTISLTSENVYPKTTLINSFEGITFDKNGPNTAGYGNYFDGTDITQSDILSDNTLITCQGTQSVRFDGFDANNSYYIGGMYFYPPLDNYAFYGYETDSLYFNAYVYSYGDNSANLTFTFSEDDNGDNIIDAVNDDVWSKEILLTAEKGWSILSVRMKDFTDSNPLVGNTTFNPDKIKGFNLNFNARSAGIKARANVDYIIVSYGKPFEP